MADLIIFPDVEAATVGELSAALTGRLPGVGIGTRLQPGDGDFIRVTRTGGPKETLISEQAIVLLESYSEDETRAERNLAVARAVLNSQDGLIFGVEEFSGPANLPDPTTSQTRYTQTFGVRVRGSVTA